MANFPFLYSTFSEVISNNPGPENTKKRPKKYKNGDFWAVSVFFSVTFLFFRAPTREGGFCIFFIIFFVFSGFRGFCNLCQARRVARIAAISNCRRAIQASKEESQNETPQGWAVGSCFGRRSESCLSRWELLSETLGKLLLGAAPAFLPLAAPPSGSLETLTNNHLCRLQSSRSSAVLTSRCSLLFESAA